MKRFVIIVSVFWFILVVVSCAWNVISAVKGRTELAVMGARSFFEQIVITRAWNSGHGGVYVPVNKSTRPNPYLEDKLREIKVNDRLTLTKINPAYMTRQISEIASLHTGIQFHITSLNPIRPLNKPTELEKKALLQFENGVAEYYTTIKDEDSEKFFYMAPLSTSISCLKCHAKQGYKEGDIRGGISVLFRYKRYSDVSFIVFLFMIIGLAGYIGIIIFSRKLQYAYDLIKKQAISDVLTGIPNRRSFTEYLLKECNRCKRYKTPLSLIMCDIDFFKRYNDTYGHLEGDKCLKTIAHTIQESIKRPGDFCARYGGEEFVIVLPDTDHDGAMVIAEDIRKEIESLKITNGPEGSYITISLGVASKNEGDDGIITQEKLIQNADAALYKAKKNGRNRVER